jgi:hypothetical protein
MKVIINGTIKFNKKNEYKEIKKRLIDEKFANNNFWIDDHGNEMFFISPFNDLEMMMEMPDISIDDLYPIIKEVNEEHDAILDICIVTRSEHESFVTVIKNNFISEEVFTELYSSKETEKEKNTIDLFMFNRNGKCHQRGSYFDYITKGEKVEGLCKIRDGIKADFMKRLNKGQAAS